VNGSLLWSVSASPTPAEDGSPSEAQSFVSSFTLSVNGWLLCSVSASPFSVVPYGFAPSSKSPSFGLATSLIPFGFYSNGAAFLSRLICEPS
jgi:hypothetical protein